MPITETESTIKRSFPEFPLSHKSGLFSMINSVCIFWWSDERRNVDEESFLRTYTLFRNQSDFQGQLDFTVELAQQYQSSLYFLLHPHCPSFPEAWCASSLPRSLKWVLIYYILYIARRTIRSPPELHLKWLWEQSIETSNILFRRYCLQLVGIQCRLTSLQGCGKHVSVMNTVSYLIRLCYLVGQEQAYRRLVAYIMFH